MVRISSTISSRLILAGFYAGIVGLTLYAIFWRFLRVPPYEDGVASSLYQDASEGAFQVAVEMLNAIGPLFGIIPLTAPFLPITFINASLVCPSRVIITSTEIRAKFMANEKHWPMSSLNSVSFHSAGGHQFISLNVAGRRLKCEIQHGAWGRIRDLIPPEIAAKTEG